MNGIQKYEKKWALTRVLVPSTGRAKASMTMMASERAIVKWLSVTTVDLSKYRDSFNQGTKSHEELGN